MTDTAQPIAAGSTAGLPPIPFHRPSIGDRERAAALAVLDSGWLTTGERSIAFERAIAEATTVRHAIAVNSATAALHLALEALGIGPGDEVLVPTYTFAACGEVVRYLGATPRLIDVDARTLNVTPAAVEAAIGPRTKAVIVVHFGGLMADVDGICRVAAARGIPIVEDAAHAFPATRAGRHAGSVGDAGALSFYATTTITTGGEGGMLLTNSDSVADRARTMRLHGISRDAWNRYSAAGSWYYEIEDAGFKYNLTDLAAAIGLAQLERAGELRAARERVAHWYNDRLADSLDEPLDLPPSAAPGDVHAWHLYPVRLTSGGADRRAAVIDRLKAAGIGTSVHFIPLHLHPYYQRTFDYRPGDLPVATHEYEREISLPIYPDLTESEVDRVVTALQRALTATA
jgi:dTDP-4-amino-4,6-dideoxygalactose transaminase